MTIKTFRSEKKARLSEKNFFSCRRETHLSALRRWLKYREYNRFILSNDQKGNMLIGLLSEKKMEDKKRGIICVTDSDIESVVVREVEGRMKQCTI